MGWTTAINSSLVYVKQMYKALMHFPSILAGSTYEHDNKMKLNKTFRAIALALLGTTAFVQADCSSDEDCDKMQYCKDNYCLPLTCQFDEQCDAGQYCSEYSNVCTDGCKTDKNCALTEICRGDTCVSATAEFCRDPSLEESTLSRSQLRTISGSSAFSLRGYNTTVCITYDISKNPSDKGCRPSTMLQCTPEGYKPPPQPCCQGYALAYGGYCAKTCGSSLQCSVTGSDWCVDGVCQPRIPGVHCTPEGEVPPSDGRCCDPMLTPKDGTACKNLDSSCCKENKDCRIRHGHHFKCDPKSGKCGSCYDGGPGKWAELR